MDEVPVFSLLYVSTPSLSAVMALGKTMQDILVASDRNNRRDGITGFLLCDGQAFAQWLEGPEPQVRACFSRIGADPRNHRPQVRETGWSTTRLFPTWSMCALNLSGTDNLLLWPRDIGFDLFQASPGALRQHLATLAHRHGPDLLRAHSALLDQPGT